MVDPDPGYRPRRAFVDPTAAKDPAADAPTPAEPPVDPAPPPAAPTGPAGATALTGAGAGDEADQPKPLYRDEVTPTPGPPAGSAPDGASSEETRVVRPLSFRQRPPRPTPEDEATTLLPRTVSAGRRPRDGEDDDLEEEHGRRLLGARGRLALLIGAMAAVIAVGIAVIYAVSTVGNPTADPSVTSPSVTAPSGSGTPAPDPATLLDEPQLLSAAAAGQIDRRAWKVALTQRPPAADAPLPACLTQQPAEGEPTAQQKVVRVLTSSGKDAPSALHQASAYSSPEEAAQAYAVASRTFGGCVAAGSSIVSGATVSGLGDQSVALVVDVVTDGQTRLHSVVLSRTGSVVDIVDAAQPGRAPALAGVAKALAAVVTAQCQPAGGACTAQPVLKDAPPPLGGDEPGFLATGDLPPAGKDDETWLATPAELPSESFLGSQCETVTWSRVRAEALSSRVYLVPSSTTFGLNDIVLTMKDEKAAKDLVAKVKDDLGTCPQRKLTATVSEPKQVTGPGAQGSTVTGWTSTVTQKLVDGTQRYRVGIVSSGAKVSYTFLNPLPGGYDLTQPEWDRVAVRAGQRMTQVP